MFVPSGVNCSVDRLGAQMGLQRDLLHCVTVPGRSKVAPRAVLGVPRTLSGYAIIVDIVDIKGHDG
jgi:hypothetical protein